MYGMYGICIVLNTPKTWSIWWHSCARGVLDQRDKQKSYQSPGWIALQDRGTVCWYGMVWYVLHLLHEILLAYVQPHVPTVSSSCCSVSQPFLPHCWSKHVQNPANNDGSYIPCKGANFSFKKLTKKTSSNWAQNYRRPRIQDCSKREGGWLDVLDVPWENHWGWPAVMKRDDGLGSWTAGPNEVWALHLQQSFNSDKMD